MLFGLWSTLVVVLDVGKVVDLVVDVVVVLLIVVVDGFIIGFSET